MKQGIWAILALPLLTFPALAAEKYHDCRPSEDIINGRTVHKTICQDEKGDWVEPEKKKAGAKPTPAPVAAMFAQKPKPAKKPVYHDCRPSEDIVNGRTVRKIVCQNEAGAWVEVSPRDL